MITTVQCSICSLWNAEVVKNRAEFEQSSRKSKLLLGCTNVCIYSRGGHVLELDISERTDGTDLTAWTRVRVGSNVH